MSDERPPERTADRLRCPACHRADTHVLGKHHRKRDGAIVRRHRCGDCGQRFTSEQKIAHAA